MTACYCSVENFIVEKMAVQAAAALLDELMGRYRNLAPTEKTKELNWEDPEVRYYIFYVFYNDLTFVLAHSGNMGEHFEFFFINVTQLLVQFY